MRSMERERPTLRAYFEIFICDESGQAIVEYILLLALMVVAIAGLMAGFRQSIWKLWQKLTQEISAACPKCPADPRLSP